MRSNNASPVTKCRSGGSLVRPIRNAQKDNKFLNINSNNAEINQTKAAPTPAIQNVKLIGMKIRDEFICPITLELLKDPVCASDGYTYERLALEKWLKSNEKSPLTGQMMEKNFICNMNIKKMIRDLIAEGGVGLYSYDSSLRDRVIEICPQKVLILKCLGPSENEWHGRSQEITHAGCIGGRKIIHTFREGRPTDVMHFTDSTVSRRHFEVTYDQLTLKYRIKDLGSAGGTYIRIPFGQRKQLHKGMMLAFGKHEFYVSTLIDEVTGDDETYNVDKKSGNSSIQNSTRNRSQSASSASVYSAMQYDVTDDTPMKKQPVISTPSVSNNNSNSNSSNIHDGNNNNNNSYNNQSSSTSSINNNRNNNNNNNNNNNDNNDNNNHNNNNRNSNNNNNNVNGCDNIEITDSLDQLILCRNDRLVSELIQMRLEWTRRYCVNLQPIDDAANHNSNNSDNSSNNNNSNNNINNTNTNTSNNNNNDNNNNNNNNNNSFNYNNNNSSNTYEIDNVDEDGDQEAIISLERGCSNAIDDEKENDDCNVNDCDNDADKAFITQIPIIHENDGLKDSNHTYKECKSADDNDNTDITAVYNVNVHINDNILTTGNSVDNVEPFSDVGRCDSVPSYSRPILCNNSRDNTIKYTLKPTQFTSCTATSSSPEKEKQKVIINVRCALTCFSPIDSIFYGKTFEIDRKGAVIGRKLSCDIAICPKPPAIIYSSSFAAVVASGCGVGIGGSSNGNCGNCNIGGNFNINVNHGGGGNANVSSVGGVCNNGGGGINAVPIERYQLLPIDTAVSGEHAKIDFDDVTGLFYVSDGNGCRPSTNGTWQRLSSAFAESPHYPIDCGTEVLVGSVRFQAQSTLTIVEKVVSD